jgi:hypothetical protein
MELFHCYLNEKAYLIVPDQSKHSSIALLTKKYFFAFNFVASPVDVTVPNKNEAKLVRLNKARNPALFKALKAFYRYFALNKQACISYV